jgi:LDH2 family malate/lactate/ureidoglycolate dehydrogenase
MPPWGGTERLLGTNPIAVAIPAGDEPGFQLDIATTVASHGTIKLTAQRGECMPEGWVTDVDGNPITDPARADEGFLTPIGGYKGSGLNIMIGMFAGVLNGAAFGRDVIDHRVDHQRPTNTGQAIFMMRPDLFGPADEFLAAMDRQLAELRSSPSMTGESVRLPGDAAAATEAANLAAGVPVPAAVVASLTELAARHRVEAPFD